MNRLECPYGAYAGDVLREWVLSHNVWVDGSMVADELTGTASAGCGVLAPRATRAVSSTTCSQHLPRTKIVPITSGTAETHLSRFQRRFTQTSSMRK